MIFDIELFDIEQDHLYGRDMDAREHVDEAIEAWARLVPELDVVTMRIALLLGRVTLLGRKHVEGAFEATGISSGEFDVLASLLHAPDHTSKPSALARLGMLSPAGMTHRLDLLEGASLIERRPDPDDRRSTLIVLTAKGEAKAREAAQAHVGAEADLLGALDQKERLQLTRLLESLLDAYAHVDVPVGD